MLKSKTASNRKVEELVKENELEKNRDAETTKSGRGGREKSEGRGGQRNSQRTSCEETARRSHESGTVGGKTPRRGRKRTRA